MSGSVQGSKRKRLRNASGDGHTTSGLLDQLQYAASVVDVLNKTTTNDSIIQASHLPSENSQYGNGRSHAPVDDARIGKQDESLTNSSTMGAVRESNELPTSNPSQSGPERLASEQADPVEDEIQLVATSPAPNMKLETDLARPILQTVTQAQSQTQDFSALVSPPDSSHTDAENSPTASKPQQSPSASSNSPSRSSSEQPNQQQDQQHKAQRYTPESGIARRARSSTLSEPSVNEKTASPRESQPPFPTLDDTMPSNKMKRTKPRASSGEVETDEESLRLIKELAAQDLGLRRRGRA